MRYEPQLCSDFTGVLPKDAVVEMKEDGVWAQWEGGALINRDGRRITHRYPDVVPHLPRDCVLVMELCVFEWRDCVRFSKFEGGIQRRSGLENPTEIRLRTKAFPVTAYVFDVLEANGVSLAAQPLRERRQALEKLLPPVPVRDAGGVARVVVADQYTGDQFQALRHQVETQGHEGLIIKDASAPHRPGRSNLWMKWKDFQEGTFQILGHETTPKDGFCIQVQTRAGPQRVVVNDVAFQGHVKKGATEAVLGYLNHTVDGSLRQPFVKQVK